ncbi:MAG: hypothetical protein ABUL64_00740 [Singulisphaera sp.]
MLCAVQWLGKEGCLVRAQASQVSWSRGRAAAIMTGCWFYGVARLHQPQSTWPSGGEFENGIR